MTEQARYKIFCVTEDEWVDSEWVSAAITTCPHNASHTVLESSVVAITGQCSTEANVFLTAQFRLQFSSGDAIWARVTVEPGTYDRIQCLIEGGSESSRYIDLGVYECDGGTPPRPTGTPVASTGMLSTDGHDHSFWTKSLTSDLVIEEEKAMWFGLANSDWRTEYSGSGVLDRAWSAMGVFVCKDDYGDVLGTLPETYDDLDSGVPYIGLLRK